MKALIKEISKHFGDFPVYKAHNLREVTFLYGTPPVRIVGLQYVLARHNYQQTIPKQCLTGKGVFLANKNNSGIIELGIMTGSASCAGIQVMDFTEIPFPISVSDGTSGGTSTVVASACRRIGTPEWRREKEPGLTIFTFYATRLLISDGLRLLE